MSKGILFCFLLFTLSLKAQNQSGQIAISLGVGYSPEFNGQVGGFASGYPTYPSGINGNAQEGFGCYDITPNIGGTIEYSFNTSSSIGIASSYQSEEVNYAGGNSNVYDKITRINLTVRFLGHLNRNHQNFDHYIGVRFGGNYWGDLRPQGAQEYFLTNPNKFKPCFQVLYGMRIYITNHTGLHLEVGLGQPYLAEGGLTFRINTRKIHSTDTPVNAIKQDNEGGHPAK